MPLRFVRSQDPRRPAAWAVLAMKRSGHHLFIDWACRGLADVAHHNFCRFRRRGLRLAIVPRHGRLLVFRDGQKTHDRHLETADYDRLCRKHARLPQIYSFEEVELEPDVARLMRHPSVRPIVLIRDPYNCLASQIKSGRMSDERYDRKLARYKEQLRWALDRRHAAPGQPIVSYNRFVTQPDYRAAIADAYGIELDRAEFAMRSVPDFGRGSTYSGLDWSPDLAQNVMKRWQTVVDHPIFRRVLDDAELPGLTRALFAESVGALPSVVADAVGSDR